MMLVPVMSAGIRSGVNWMRLKSRSRRVGEGADHQRLAQAGHAFEQGVAVAEQADEQALDQVVLAHHRPLDLAEDGAGPAGR